jgi:hypothetical protein
VRLAASGAAIVLAGGLVARQLAHHGPSSALDDFAANERIADQYLQTIPPGGLAMVSFFSSYFALWNVWLVDGRRPDLAVMNQTFDAKLYDGVPYTEALRRHFPRFTPVFDAWLASRAYPAGPVIEAARRDPVFVEPALGGPVPSHALRGRPLAFQVIGDPSTATEPAPAELAATWESLTSQIQPELASDRWTRAFLLWHHYHAAFAWLERGLPAHASVEIERGRAINPLSPELQALDALAAQAQRSPMPRSLLIAELHRIATAP